MSKEYEQKSNHLKLFTEFMNEYSHLYNDEDRISLANEWLFEYYKELKSKFNKQ